MVERNPVPSRELRLQSYTGQDIPNWIDAEASPGMIELARATYSGLLGWVRSVGAPTGRYNCHGLTFAGRRTNIPRPGETSRGLIDTILRQDRFAPIPDSLSVQVGDIALWRREGDVDHTGIVVSVQTEAPRTVFVWSMWGGLGEFVHPAQATPYDDCQIEYWRLGG